MAVNFRNALGAPSTATFLARNVVQGRYLAVRSVHRSLGTYFGIALLSLVAACGSSNTKVAANKTVVPATSGTITAPLPTQAQDPLLMLGVGDAVTVQVYGQPELNTTTYVGDDGAIPVPLAGPVHVAGMSPAGAAQEVANALKKGQYLVNPQVTIMLSQARSQQASVLGEVKTPGRFPIESKTTVLDLLAQAGGTTENSSSVVYLIRPDKTGNVVRQPIDLKGLLDGKHSIPTMTLKANDSVFVPRAENFYIYGEVHAPNMYRLEPDMTVVQAISRGGGVTPRGSNSRIVIERHAANGKETKIKPELTDKIQPNDVIRVKERIF